MDVLFSEKTYVFGRKPNFYSGVFENLWIKLGESKSSELDVSRYAIAFYVLMIYEVIN